MDPSTGYDKFTGVWTSAESAIAPLPNPNQNPNERHTDPNWTVPKPDLVPRGIVGKGKTLSGLESFPDWTPSWPPYPHKTHTDAAFGFYPTASWGPPLDVRGDAETTPRPRETPSVYPYPNLALPHPSLNLDFRMSLKLGDRIPVGSNSLGRQTWIAFTGGSWSGPWGTGIVLPGGQDSETTLSNGSSRLDAKFLLQTHERPPAFINVKANGWTTGPVEVLTSLADADKADSVDPTSYRFKISIDMETADERYRDKVNCGMWVGSGIWRSSEIIFDAYRVS